jgi:hypothetical protein
MMLADQSPLLEICHLRASLSENQIRRTLRAPVSSLNHGKLTSKVEPKIQREISKSLTS